MTKTQIFLQNFCHGQICCPKTLESRKKPAENKQTAKAVCYLSRYSYSTVYEKYIDYYTNKRVQRNLGVLTPLEFHEQKLENVA
ncbi:IS3 family transposase [Blautia sp.]|uniref:IS3 family transposase n=1 Tax=Blautia sp. TaxID=1955243 RepID=UPI002FE68EB1